MSNLLYNKAKEYVDYWIAGKKVKIPYVLSTGYRWHFWRTCGKGTPKQIREETFRLAKKRGVSLDLISGVEITHFMKRNGIGLDCSGFVYQLLNEFVKVKKGYKLDKYLIRYKGLLGKVERLLLRPYRVRRISAQDLTSDLNTDKIEKVSQIRKGDLIRFTPMRWTGKHVAIIVEVTPKYLVYAHSSRDSRKQGPHFGKIEILDENLGLEKQNWLEVTKDGENYGSHCYKIETGDSVRRLKCLRA